MTIPYSDYYSSPSGSNFQYDHFPSSSHVQDTSLHHVDSPLNSQEDDNICSENSNSPHNGLGNGEDGKDLTGGTVKKLGRQKNAMTNAERRATHNAIERARRESLNGRFLQLADALPSMANVKRPSKSIIVNKSLEYINESIMREQMLIKENFDLRREVDELRSRLGMPPLPPSQLSMQLSAAAVAAQQQQVVEAKKKMVVNPANVPLPPTPTTEYQPQLDGIPNHHNPSILAATALTSQWKSSTSGPSNSNRGLGMNFGFPNLEVPTTPGGSYFGLTANSGIPNSNFGSFSNGGFEYAMTSPHPSMGYPGFGGPHPAMVNPYSYSLNHHISGPSSGPSSSRMVHQNFEIPISSQKQGEEVKREESNEGFGIEDGLINGEDDGSEGGMSTGSSSSGRVLSGSPVLDPSVHPLTSALGIEIFSPVKFPSVPLTSLNLSKKTDESSLGNGSVEGGKSNFNGWFTNGGNGTVQQEPFSLFSSF